MPEHLESLVNVKRIEEIKSKKEVNVSMVLSGGMLF